MWLLGVLGFAAGLVLVIYLVDVLSSTFASRIEGNRRDEILRRTKELTRQWNERRWQKRDDGDGPDQPNATG